MSFVEQLDSKVFAGLPQLQVLDISYSGFEYVPAWVFELSNLTKLFLQGNPLHEFPRQLHELPNLRHLTVGDAFGSRGFRMQMSHGDLSGFVSQARLKELALSGIQSETVLEEISHLKTLEALTIAAVDLTTIPEGWFQLPNLRSLRLDPRTHMLSDKAKKINIQEVYNLRSLEKLELNGIVLDGFLKSLPEIRGLKSLDLNYTYLGKFPLEVLGLSQLESLGLIDCNIAQLPKEIAELQSLKRLNLSGNPITSLPEEIGFLHQLEFLWLANTQLKGVPHSFGQLTNLTELSLHSAKLDRWPEEVLGLNKLENLVLSRTGISEIPSEIQSLPLLKNLEIEEKSYQESSARNCRAGSRSYSGLFLCSF